MISTISEIASINLSLSAVEPSIGLLGLAFSAGFLFSFNPVTFATIPVALTYVAKDKIRSERIWHSAAFILGLLTTHVALEPLLVLAANGWKK